MNKAQLSEHLVSTMGFDKPTAVQFVNEFFKQISQALLNGETVKIGGFGSFLVYDKKPRLARNPKTKTPVWVQRRRVIAFRAGRKFKNAVKQDIFAE